MPPAKLLVFDLDYTLRTPKGLFPGVAEELERYRSEGLRISMASYNYSADQILTHYGVRDMFDFVIGGYHKLPKSVHLRTILQLYESRTQFDFQPRDAIFADDMTHVCSELRYTFPELTVINCLPSVGVDLKLLRQTVERVE